MNVELIDHPQLPEGPDGVPPSQLEFIKQLGRPLKVGGIDYLNSRPLIETFDQVAGREVELFNEPPSELARLLREGELDVALIPVAEYLTQSSETEYQIVPGLGISSYGKVESIKLFYHGALSEIQRVGLDRSSMSSVLLTKLLFHSKPDARWRGEKHVGLPQFEKLTVESGIEQVEKSIDPSQSSMAILLIGDAAIKAKPGSGWSTLDLGLEWTRWTGLPFVYAFWAYRGKPPKGLIRCLEEVAKTGFAAIDRIVDQSHRPTGMNRDEALRYLSHVIRFRLQDAEIKGLTEFSHRLNEAGLVKDPQPLRFIDSVSNDSLAQQSLSTGPISSEPISNEPGTGESLE